MSSITGNDICTLWKDGDFVYPDEVRAAAGCDNVDGNLVKAEDVITNVITGITVSLGIVCAVVILYGGVQYLTSTGDPTKTKKAKDTILYGVIGLVICVLAFAIANFVIGVLNEGTNPTPVNAKS